MSDTTSVKSTLFRFNTLRAPQAIEHTKKDRTSVLIKWDSSYFKEQISSPLDSIERQLEQLKERCRSFTALRTVQELIEAVGEGFYNYSNYLAANRQKIYEQETIATDTVRSMSQRLEERQLQGICDNLFYQLVTHESPELRELCIQAVIADFFSNNIEQHWLNEAAMAVAMVPPDFYGIKDSSMPMASRDTTVTGTLQTHQLKKVVDTAITKAKAERYQRVAQEFTKAEKAWQKDNTATFERAKSEYDNRVKATLAEVSGERNAPTNRESLARAIELEPMDFTPPVQLDSSVLGSRLSAEAQLVASQLGLYGLGNFKEVQENLLEAAKNEHAKLFESATLSARALQTETGILIFDDGGGGGGGGTIPPAPGQQYTYVITPFQMASNKYKFFLCVQAGAANTSAVYASYNAHYGSTNNASTDFTTQSIRQNLLVELFPSGITIPGSVTTVNLSGELRTSTGVTLNFNGDVTIQEGGSGTMDPGSGNGNGDGNGGTGSTGGTGSGVDEDYVPSGFGVRRLGIADYRKVEQSVCCYVPGEVSHIENIMASEYKERSTRRLRRTEDTTTTETQMQKENQTDTSSTERYELQQEIASAMNQSTSIGASANTSFKAFGGAGTVSIGASFAHNVSQQESNRQAVNYAKEVTEKALEKVVQKVRQERVSKVIDEFEEQNKHGFDNRKGNKHVSGVYRWVDKVYKNQVLNYGKRLMYEFMVPQPAVFHTEAMRTLVNNPNAIVLEKPIDPRSEAAGLQRITSHKALTEANYHLWAAAYNADVEAPPVQSYYTGTNFKFDFNNIGDWIELTHDKEVIDIPDAYNAVKWQATINAMDDNDPMKYISISVGDKTFTSWGTSNPYLNRTELPVQDIRSFGHKIPVSYMNFNYWFGEVNVNIGLQLKPEFFEAWQIKTFNAILEGYQKKLDSYLQSIQGITVGTKATNPGFYRQIENTVLRKNCITYLTSHNKLGQKWYSGDSVTSLQPTVTDKMDRYASLARFVEDAFEWDTIGYNFLPFYWGNRDQWQSMYQQDVDDALFRSFLQAGFAKVIVAVRPGFEQAVMHYMATGQVWNGGQVPVIGDDLYLSIVDELKNPEYVVEDTWETRVPSSLTVIQAGSIGLNTQGLPCDCGDDNGIANNDGELGVVLPEESGSNS